MQNIFPPVFLAASCLGQVLVLYDTGTGSCLIAVMSNRIEWIASANLAAGILFSPPHTPSPPPHTATVSDVWNTTWRKRRDRTTSTWIKGTVLALTHLYEYRYSRIVYYLALPCRVHYTRKLGGGAEQSRIVERGRSIEWVDMMDGWVDGWMDRQPLWYFGPEYLEQYYHITPMDQKESFPIIIIVIVIIIQLLYLCPYLSKWAVPGPPLRCHHLITKHPPLNCRNFFLLPPPSGAGVGPNTYDTLCWGEDREWVG